MVDAEEAWKVSNPNPKTTTIVRDIYTLHRIHNFLNPPALKKATGVEEASGSGGGTGDCLGVALSARRHPTLRERERERDECGGLLSASLMLAYCLMIDYMTC
jgi:hypothetical protein